MQETVTLYSPSGNPEVHLKRDEQGLLERGYETQESFQERKAREAEEKRVAWLNDPASLEERFASLRSIRDNKIAATDYLLYADYPLEHNARGEIVAYRKALRDLPALAGAPWDGGGELTPWPEMPKIK